MGRRTLVRTDGRPIRWLGSSLGGERDHILLADKILNNWELWTLVGTDGHSLGQTEGQLGSSAVAQWWEGLYFDVGPNSKSLPSAVFPGIN